MGLGFSHVSALLSIGMQGNKLLNRGTPDPSTNPEPNRAAGMQSV